VYGFADRLSTIDESVIENVIQERKEGGLFTDTRQEAVIPVSSERTELTDSKLTAHQFNEANRRLLLLENRIDSLDQRLTWLSKHKESRDEIVLELFKMLKDSMEKRIKTLVTIHGLKRKQ
jgi:hypothetical protein